MTPQTREEERQIRAQKTAAAKARRWAQDIPNFSGKFS